MKVMITGAGGLVGRAMIARCQAEGESIKAFEHARLDIADESAINSAFDEVQPEVVINCAAMTDVDGCESSRDRAMNANALGPELLAIASRRVNALLLTISTDYVFDGQNEGFYTQRDQPNPLSVYGASKLEGERRTQIAWARTIVVRTGYIFGVGGKNFLSTVVERARRGEQLNVITDSFGTPTYAADLAKRLHRLAQFDLPGIFHVVNSGKGASFADFSQRALALAGLAPDLLRPIEFASLARPAARPRNSRLRCLLSEAIGLEPLPAWEQALATFIDESLPQPAASTAE